MKYLLLESTMKHKKNILSSGWFNPFADQPKHSYVDTKALDDFDVEYLRLLLIAEENNVMKVLENEKWYSEETIKRYKKMKESIKNLQDAIHVKCEFEDVQRIPESW